MRTRLTLDSMVDDFLDMNRFSRSKRFQKPELILPTPKSTFSRFVNTDRRIVQDQLRQDRTDSLVGLNRYKQKLASKPRPELVFAQAVALAQRLFAEIARHPDAFMKLSQAETTALNSQVTSTPVTKGNDPKAALRFAAIQAMSQAYPMKNVVLSSAFKKIDDVEKKESLEKDALSIRLGELGYTPSEIAAAASKTEHRGVTRFVLSGTISTREDLESILRSPKAAKELQKKLA